MKQVQLPLTPQAVQEFSVGDQVSLNGIMYAAGETAHKFIYEGGTVPTEVSGSALLHCFPIVRRIGSRWEIETAAPRHSAAVEEYQADLLGRCGFRVLMGAGGAGAKTLAACRRFGAIYIHTFGGAELAIAKRIKQIKQPFLKDQIHGGDALWEIEVENLPGVVTLDAHNRSLPDIVKDVSSRRLMNL